jgi:hypothetical protein
MNGRLNEVREPKDARRDPVRYIRGKRGPDGTLASLIQSERREIRKRGVTAEVLACIKGRVVEICERQVEQLLRQRAENPNETPFTELDAWQLVGANSVEIAIQVERAVNDPLIGSNFPIMLVTLIVQRRTREIERRLLDAEEAKKA